MAPGPIPVWGDLELATTTMKTRAFVTTLLALSVLAAAAGVAVPTGSPDDPSIDREPVLAQSDGSATATATDSGSASGGSDTAARPTDPRNYTRLYVDAERPYLRLEPGESDEYTVTVENGDDHAVDLDPHVNVPPTGGPVIEASWVTIDGPDRLDAGEEGEFTVSVDVPDDAEIGRYSGQVAFTDETVAYPGRPAQPVHAEHVRVEVWKEPTVTIHSQTYVHGQVEAGESMTREIVVENSGDEAVPLNPELTSERHVCRGNCPEAFDRSWLDVDAPSQVGPGETATVSITISPPADTDRGRYNTEIDLGLKDPNRDERNTHWQRVRVNVEVWSQPDSPFETTFDVSERTDDVTLTLTPRSGAPRPGAVDDESEPAAFDVAFVGPNGTVVEPTRVQVTDQGFVDMSGDNRRTTGDGEYAVSGGNQELVYRLEEPSAGEWTLRVTPENTVGFGYEITRNEG